MARKVLVTGGTGGLGRAVIPELVAAGFEVVTTYRSAEEWQALQAEQPTVAGVAVDLLDEQALGKAVQEHGPFYGLVALAGGFAMGGIVETSLETWQQQLAMNATSLLVSCKAVLPGMQAAGAGRIVAVASAVVPQAPAGLGAYTAAKRGVLALTETLSHELQGTGITANAVLPATLDTPANRPHMPADQLVPLNYVSGVISFLLSDAAAGVTGAGIPITVTGR